MDLRSGTFDWRETHAVLDAAARAHPLEVIRPGVVIAGDRTAPTLQIDVPAVLPRLEPAADLAAWCDALPDRLGTEALLLLRAGSAALGLWRDDALLLHKVFKRYVVRGHGKAQSAHLKTKGKSRYGSRLRLQNAQRLLEEVNERLRDWDRDEGPLDALHWACPVRLWADLFAAMPSPPLAVDDPRLVRVTIHVHEPDFAELQRVRHRLRTGRVTNATPSDVET